MKRIILVILMLTVMGMAVGPTPAVGQFFFMENPMLGGEVPDFTLNTLSGQEVNFNKFRDGKKAIIFFWATWCPHCREALDELSQNKKELEEKDIKLVLVDVGEGGQVVKDYMRENKIDFEVFLDEEQTLADTYALIGVPTFFFVNEKGIVKGVKHSLPENYDKILSG